MSQLLKSRLVLLVIVLAIASIYVFYNAWPIENSRHNQVVDGFIELEKNQMEIKQIILKINLNQNSNFDRLTQLQKRQEVILDYIKRSMAIILKNESGSVLSHLNQYSSSQGQISILIDNIKRSSAILKNSTRYFVFLGKDFTDYLYKSAGMNQQSSTVKQIISDTLIFEYSLKEQMNISNEKNALILSGIISRLNLSDDSEYILLPKHLNIIDKYRRLTESSMNDLLSVPIEKIAENTFVSYREKFQSVEKQRRIYTDLAIFIITSLIILVAYYFFMLIKTKSDLFKEKTHLQNKVSENVITIEQTTQALIKEKDEVRKLSTAMEQSHDAVIITDTDGTIEYVNPKFTEISGYLMEEVIGRNPRLLRSDETPKEIYMELWETIKKGDTWRNKICNKKKNGELYWASESISPIFNAEGDITHFLSTHSDITQEYKLNEQLNFHASHDALTGLVNRREFERRVDRLLSTLQQDKSEHALCFMDMDRFKIVNDTCGHVAGDEMLRQLSSVLDDIVRHRDTLARLGGDEFGVLMEHCSLNDAHRVAKSLLSAVNEYQFSWEGHSFKVGMSIGMVPITETTANLTDLLKNADAACYMAKDQGRNRIHVYHAGDVEMAQRHGEIQWVTRLNQALKDDRFCLYVQSIVPLDGSTDKHYELLLRMVDEKGDLISPGVFLPAAERYDLISKIDHWVIENAFGLLADNPDFLKQINFCSINLSGQSMAEQDFLEFVIKQLDESGIQGEKICFEITETAAISNLYVADRIIATLNQFGCRFALDDFGSGLSSYGYLKSLPVNYLKIDGMFVKDIVDDPIDHAMVKSINEIGHVMGMKTIAEFVENDVIKGMLKEIGVNYAQGYGIDKPIPFDELLDRSRNVIDIKTPKTD